MRVRGEPESGHGDVRATHTYVLPVVLGAVGVLGQTDLATELALIWIAPIGVDRAIGYELKYPSASKDTHLQRV